jgi:multidrug efflux pump subunit AcrB
VAGNLLMLFILAGGILTIIGLKLEIFPDVSPNIVNVSVVYPGATPEEIEEGVCIKVEEAIRGLEGIKKVTSSSSENAGIVSAEIEQDADLQEVLDEIKSRVDAISTFPVDAEKPVVVEAKPPKIVLSVVVSGKTDERTLKSLAQEVRDELAALPEISRVDIANARPYEISIEVSEDALSRYGLSFDDVAGAVRQGSLNLSGGTVKTRAGEIILRSDTQAYVGREFEDILLLRSPDGTRITIGDVATVVDGFEDVDQFSEFDGDPALTITVFRIGKQSAPDVAQAVKTYLEEKRTRLPEGISLTVWKDWSRLLHERLTLLLRNGQTGLILIFVILTLFLRLRLAFWVALGIPISFLGAIWILPSADVTINMMSLFAFIVVLGILVDDAIVVGENIYHHSRLGKSGRDAAKDGAKEVMKPVILAVLTTIAAFVPMLTLPGTMGQFARVVPIVVIVALAFSLIESLLILPAHLRHMKPPQEEKKPWVVLLPWVWFTGLFSKGLELFVRHVYRPLLGVALRWRYLTLAMGIGVIVLTVGLFGAGYVRFSFFPPIAGDQLVAMVTLPEGTPVENTGAVVGRITEALEEVRQEVEGDERGSVFKHVLVSVGTQPQVADDSWESGGGAPSGSHLGEVFVELQPPEVRGEVRPEDIMRRLRERVGPIPEAREVRYDVAINSLGKPINVELRSPSLDDLRTAADRLKEHLATYDGTFDIADNMIAGKREIRLFVKPEAEALGITQAELARQVRQGFYGDEAQRIQRGRDDIKVMVRYPSDRRRSLADLDEMRIRLPDGSEVPFATVARAEEGRGPAIIRHAEGQRSVRVTADLDLVVANANQIAADLRKGLLADLEAEYAGLRATFEGEQKEQSETMGGLYAGSVLAVLLIYTLLALAFGSFAQPIVVLTAIPFGMVGAVLGHWWMGLDLTLLSSIGFLAMAGVVVNDSMILIDFVNRAREAGTPVLEAVRQAGPRRFRAIILTSLTTFAGLAPLLMEKAAQAQFLIPMAVSLAFGVAFSTMVTLLIVPSSYLILEDLVNLFRHREAAAPAPVEATPTTT